MTTRFRRSRTCTLVLVFLSALVSGCATTGNNEANLFWQRSWDGFRSPTEDSQRSEFISLDAFDPSKIPVVFIHGLFSDSLTWNDTISRLRSDPQLESRFSFWVYRYPTGTTYLQSAADLREAMATVFAQADPEHVKPPMNNIVLVGHSMGGLLAKLQVTWSGDTIWNAISNRPLGELAGAPADQQQVTRLTYFQPQSRISRVVYIATPHGGSRWTQRPVAKIARGLIQFPSELQKDYRRFQDANRGSLESLPRNIPTSIDHLSPNSPVIAAVGRLQTAPHVQSHSIVGVGHYTPCFQLGDGIVGQQSAHVDGVQSELQIRSTHTEIHSADETVTELSRILSLHASQSN